KTLLDVLAGGAAVLGGPFDGFLHVERGADAGDVMHGTVGSTGRVRRLGDLHEGLHAGSVAAPRHRGAQREHHAIGGSTGGFRCVLIHAPDVAEELHV